VKLTDVYPDGRSMLVTDGIVRARHRESFETEKLLEPGEAIEIPVDLWSTSLVFNKGHRLRIAISSSNSPRFDPNPNTGRAFRADREQRVATNTIYFSEKHPSHIVLPVHRESATAGP
jgi:putative CocE/NonD family hydrolase